jgi:hypothetical protein
MLAIVVAVMLPLAVTGRSLSFHAGGVVVGQCRAPARTQPVTARAYEPVWRTFSDAQDRFSLSLPAGVEAYFVDRDPRTAATFDILRFVVYQPPAAG